MQQVNDGFPDGFKQYHNTIGTDTSEMSKLSVFSLLLDFGWSEAKTYQYKEQVLLTRGEKIDLSYWASVVNEQFNWLA